MLQGMMVLYLVCFVLGIFVVVRVWRASTLDGVLTLLVPGYVLYSLYKYWGDPDHDIRWPLLAQVVATGFLVWNAHHVAQTLIEQDRLAAAQQQLSASSRDDSADDDATAQPRSALSTSAPDKTARASTTHAPSAPEPATEVEAPPRRATPAELRKLAEDLGFQRGRFVREAIGMSFDIPRGQHLLTGNDARRVDTALRGEVDTSLIGWMVAEDKTVTSPGLRVVRLRWRHDGLVAPEAESFDAASLLQMAQSRPRVPRLSSSGGTLLRYDAAPDRDGSTIVWSEERQPETAAASTYDCHALRLARKGVLEISLIDVDANAAKSCVKDLLALATATRFDAAADYPKQTAGERIAPYSLAGLITQTQ